MTGTVAPTPALPAKSFGMATVTPSLVSAPILRGSDVDREMESEEV